MRAKVRVHMYRNAVERTAFYAAGTASERAADRTLQRVKDNIVIKNRVASGAMRDSARKDKIGKLFFARWRISVPVPYAKYQEYGIGPVVAKKGKVLRFRPKGMASFIFRPRTKGFKGAHFLRDAFYALRPKDFLP